MHKQQWLPIVHKQNSRKYLEVERGIVDPKSLGKFLGFLCIHHLFTRSAQYQAPDPRSIDLNCQDMVHILVEFAIHILSFLEC